MCLNQGGVAEIRDERRIVTALFADVARSTELAERLDPEDVKLVIGEAIGRAIRIVESYGGTIKDGKGNLYVSDGHLILRTCVKSAGCS